MMKVRRLKMKRRHHRGSILQITLIIITIMMQVLLSYSLYIQQTAQYDQSIVLLNEQREIEIYLHRHLLKTYENDLLLSDTIYGENGRLKYTVDDMGSYYLLNIDIDTQLYNYSIEANLDLKDGHYKSYEY